MIPIIAAVAGVLVAADAAIKTIKTYGDRNPKK